MPVGHHERPHAAIQTVFGIYICPSSELWRLKWRSQSQPRNTHYVPPIGCMRPVGTT